MKAPRPFKALGTSCPMTFRHIPQHLIMCIHLLMLMLSFALLRLYVIKIKQQRANGVSRTCSLLSNTAVLKSLLLTGHYYLLRGMAAHRTFKLTMLKEL